MAQFRSEPLSAAVTKRSSSPLLPYGALWLVLVVGALWSRPPWPIDETRYLSVAWEMWQRGDFLVPYLNGAPYSHKPPLLFWLFHLGWWMFGVNGWWPRLVPALFAFAAVALTVRLARRLWPERPQAPGRAAWILSGSLLWIAFTTLVMFDMLVVFFVLLAIVALVEAARGRSLPALGVFGLAVGLGLLAKGPVVLMYTVPPALAAPWWSTPSRARPLAWYGPVLLALGLGGAIALAWALPAAAAGGPEYGAAILWGQTAGRVMESFAHAAPWWWYLPLLPLLLFPWLFWPPLWRALVRRRADFGARVTLSWLVPAFVGLSLVSGKQPHYLLPLFPAFALLAASALHGAHGEVRRRDALLPALALAAGGAVWVLMASGLVTTALEAPIPVFPGVVLIALASAVMLCARDALANQVLVLALASVLAAVTVYTEALQVIGPDHDLRPVAAHLAALEGAGVPLAHVGKYHGQYDFLGRLPRPIEVIAAGDVRGWLQRHPAGRVIAYTEAPGRGAAALQSDATSAGLVTEYAHPFRGARVVVRARAPATSVLAERPPGDVAASDQSGRQPTPGAAAGRARAPHSSPPPT